MAFWNRIRRTKNKHSDHNTEEILPEKKQNRPDPEQAREASGEEPERLSGEELAAEHIIPQGKAEQKRYIHDCCESVKDCDRQIGIAKTEYTRVTEYLTDIQKIDRIAGEDRESLLELCKRIQRLLQERSQYKNRTLTITERQMRRFDRYQEELIDEIKKMYQNEMYQKAIDSDIRHLEAEKAYIREEQHEIIRRQDFLKKLAKGIFGLIGSLIVLFIILYFNLDSDMTYPYIGTLALTAVSAAAIFAESNKNRYEIAVSDKRYNKAVELLNRTKIKYVNNVSVLDYNREKFGVKNAADFENLWGEYCKTKEYERRFRDNTEQLSKSNDSLQRLLDSYGVNDTEVWLVQTYAILDDREMVEIRHDLNQRRQKLREQIKYNTDTKEDYEQHIRKVVEESEFGQEILKEVLDK